MRVLRWTASSAIAVTIALILHVVVNAQQVVSVGDNVNILPVYKSTPPGQPPAPDDYLKGNILGQRCNEPSIGISPINRNTIMVFCNDYRATFNFDDLVVPAGRTSFAGAIWNGFKEVLARLVGRAREGEREQESEIEASTEAGIGGAVSYDGGRTWTGFLVPGGPFDNSSASLSHPGKIAGMQGYSDPAACSWKGSNNAAYIGLAYIGFIRDKTSGQSTSSAVYFTRYGDRNSSDVLHNIEYQTTSTVGFANNSTQGQFLDKVSCAVGSDGAVYVGFTTFTGSASSSKMNLAKSLDGGLTWSSATIDKNSTYTQASATVVKPTDATKVGLIWRTFGTPPGLVFKAPFSKTAKNVDLFLNDPGGTYRAFDQYTQPIVVPGTNPPQDNKNRIAARTLAFPAAAYTPDGKYLVAVFTEWIDLTTGNPPAATTSNPVMPLIVMKYSTDDGNTWSTRQVLNWKNGEMATVPAAPQRLGFFSPARPVGVQFQPAVACAPGNVCAVVWKQAFSSTLSAGGTENPGKLVKAGFDERFDVRGVLVKFSTALTPPNPPFSVSGSSAYSRYGYRSLVPGTGTTPGEKPSDVQDTDSWIQKTTLPNGTKYAAVDFADTNHSGAGLVAFTGDYIDIENNTAPGQPASFFLAFSDNRDNIRPWQMPGGGMVQSGTEPSYYRYFQAPAAGQWPPSCLNYGSRVQSVMTAQINTNTLTLTGPTNHKPFPDPSGATKCGPSASPNQQCIEFPVTVWNLSNQSQTVNLQLSSSGGGSFAKRPWDSTLDAGSTMYNYPLLTGVVNINPYSSYSTIAYAFSGSPITVSATSGTNAASITFNDPNVVNASAGSNFTYNASGINLASQSARNQSARNQSARNQSARNPVPADPVPGQTVYDVIDQTYVVTPSNAGDAGTYLSIFNIDPAYAGNYVFQAMVTSPINAFITDGNCSALNAIDGSLIGNISDPTNPLVTQSARNQSARNQSARNVLPADGSSVVQNTTFTLGSSVQGQQTSALGTQQAPTQGCLIDDCTEAASRGPNNQVTILVRAYQIKSTTDISASGAPLYDPDGSRGSGTTTPLSVAAAEYSCSSPSCVTKLGPDLAVQTAPPPTTSVTPTTVRAGGTVGFPTISVKNIGVDGDCGGTDANPLHCGDAGAHEWAVYASTEPSFANLLANADATGRIVENTNPALGAITIKVKPTSPSDTSTALPKLPCTLSSAAPPNCDGGTEQVNVGSLTIPANIPLNNGQPTTYYLHFYDDWKRSVNELDESNNSWTSNAITVLPPVYGFLGLQTPCTPGSISCTKTGTMPLAWQFTQGPNSTIPVDSVSTLPQVRFYGNCSAPNPSTAGPVLKTTFPNAADLTSGSSGWQYFPNTGMTRPQFTWQLNFDSTGLARGVCYAMYIEVPGTGQVITSTDPTVQPFGPFKITPQ